MSEPQPSPRRKLKPGICFKFLVANASINWKNRKRCNAYMKDSKLARRCPEYVSRARKLEDCITKIMDYRDNEDNHFMPAWKEAASFTENSSIPKGYLRRNAKKFRMARPFYNQKKNEFDDLVRQQPEKVRTKKYAENVQFNYHLETFHGFNSYELTAVPDALNSMLPPENVDPLSLPPSRPMHSLPPSRSMQPQSSRSHQQQQPKSSRPGPSKQLALPPSRSMHSLPPSRSMKPQSSRSQQQPQSSRPGPSKQLALPPSRSMHSLPPSRSMQPQSSRSQQQPQSSRPGPSKQLALPPPQQSRPPPRQQQPTKEIVLFDSKSPKQRYSGPEISNLSNTSSSRRPFRPLNNNGSTSFAEQSSLNQIASILDYDDENGLMRSFYTKYHMDQFCAADEDEKDYKSIEELANSDLIEHSITNPPPNGLRLREYSKTDYKKMRLSTKKILREWKESLAPGFYDDDAESGYDDDGEEPIETWNRLVRETKKNSRKRPHSNRRSLNETNHKNNGDGFENESFESVQSEPNQITIQQTIQRTRIIATPGFKDLRKVGRNATTETPRIVEIPDVKRSGTCVSTSLGPSPKKKRRQQTAKPAEKETPKTTISKISQFSSFKTPSSSRNATTTTIKTPSTIDIFHRIQNSGTDSETPVRRSPRVSGLKAICYKV